MALRCVSGQHSLLYVSFNQDSSCIALGTAEGVRIYNIDTHKICYRNNIGAIGLAEMLFCTSLIMYVGAGEQPSLTPRKLTVWNTSTQEAIHDLHFPSSVLAVKLNRQRLVVVLANHTHIHALQTLEHLRTVDTPPNPKGLAALTQCSEPSFLALPASPSSGVFRVYDTLVEDCSVVCEVTAHQSPLAALAWSADGTLLASASTKGTVIRVYSMPGSHKVFSFRRGTYPAVLHSLAFSPEGVDPPLLAASSSHGSIHVFRCAHPAQQHPAVAAATAAAGLLSAVMNISVSDMVEPQRNIATIRLPCPATATLCGLRLPGNGNGTTGDNLLGEDSVVLVVASAAGLLYEYLLEDLTSPLGPRCSLGGEWALLGTMHLPSS